MKKKRRRTHRKKAPVILSVLIIAAAAIGILTAALYQGDYSTVATVNGQEIVVRELKSQMNNMKAQIQNYFKVTYKAEISHDFWQGDFGGENPLEVLRSKALDECIRFKIELLLAKEHGLIDYTSYRSILDKLKSENKKRQDAVKKGKVVYGVTSFGEMEFYNHLMSNLRISLKDMLSKGEADPLYVGDEEVYKSYTDNMDIWTSKYYSYTIQKVSIPYAPEENRDAAYKRAEQALKDLEDGMGFEEVCAKYNENGKVLTQTFDLESYRHDIRSSFNLKTAAESLQINEYSREILDDGKSFNIIMLVDRQDEYQDLYQENYSTIKRGLIDEKYQALIDELVGGAEIIINEKNYNSVNIK